MQLVIDENIFILVFCSSEDGSCLWSTTSILHNIFPIDGQIGWIPVDSFHPELQIILIRNNGDNKRFIELSAYPGLFLDPLTDQTNIFDSY